jgi:ASC-1-like (ASCH) protein
LATEVRTHRLEFRAQDRVTFQLIKAGAKKIECRAGCDAYEQIEEGDVIEFVCQEASCFAMVKARHKFVTPEEMVERLPFGQLAGAAIDKDDFLKTIYRFPNYYERIVTKGMLAWEVQVMTRPQTSTFLDRCGGALKVSLKYAIFGTLIFLLVAIPSTGLRTVAEVATTFFTIWGTIFCLELIWQTYRKPVQSS